MPTTETALAVIQSGIANLKERAEAIIVRDQRDYISACNMVVEGRAYIKDVKNKLGPGIDSAKQHLDFLRNQQLQYIAPVETIVKIAEQKAETWKGEERRKAKVEEDRINEENRRAQQQKAETDRLEAERIAKETKKNAVDEISARLKAGEIGKREAARLLKLAGAEQEAAVQSAAAQAEETRNAPAKVVEVKASVPKVAGIKARVNWKFRIVDETKVPRLYCIPDEGAIGSLVRSVKDKARIEALIPGIEVWSEDGI